MEQHDWTYFALLGGCFALALLIRIRRIGKSWRLRPGTLWIIPAIFILLAAMIFRKYPPSGIGWLWVAMGLAAGGVIGWWRALLVDISVDRMTGRLHQRVSAGAMLFLVVLMLVRWLLRWAVTLGDARWHFGAMLISDIFIAIAVGAISAYRLVLYLRARRLLNAG